MSAYPCSAAASSAERVATRVASGIPFRRITVETYCSFALSSPWSSSNKKRAMSLGAITPSSVSPESTGTWRLPETVIRLRASSSVSLGVRWTRSFECVITSATGTLHATGSAVWY